MSALKKLNLEGNYEITESSIEELQKVLPDCEIKHSELKPDTETDTDTNSKKDNKLLESRP